METIFSKAQEVANNYRNSSSRTEVVEGLDFQMYEHIKETEFLASGHYLSGDYDEDGNLKPFHDIITRLLENQRTAEEVDTADLELNTNDPDYYVRAQLLSKFNQDWLIDNNIGLFLNDAIETRGKYGGLLVKVIESDDFLDLEVVDWNSFNGDPLDIPHGLKVINHFYTPSKLIAIAQERGWDMNAVDKAIDLYAQSQIDDSLKEQREAQGDYVLVREVVGDLPTYMLNDSEEDDGTYTEQIHYIAGSEFSDAEGRNLGVSFFKAELTQRLYYYLPYKKRGGKADMLGIGVVERAKHAQIQINRAAQQYKRAMDFASTHVLQSATKNLKGKNVITQMKSGSILQHDPNSPITSVDMSPQSLQHIPNYLTVWSNQADKATNTTAIGTGAGEELSSDMTYRLGAVLDQNAQSPFDLRREEFDIFLNEIYADRIIPFFIKQMKRRSVLKLKFNPEELKRLDEDLVNYRADQEILAKFFAGVYDNMPPMMKWVAMEQDKQAHMEGLGEELRKQKSRRSITDFPEGYWDDVADKIYITITNERRKKGVMAERVQNILMQYLQYKPQLDQDPEARKLFDSIVQTAGIDPIDWSNSAPAQQMAQAPGAPEAGQTALDNPEQLQAKPE